MLSVEEVYSCVLSKQGTRMIHLHGFGPHFSVNDPSAFVLKMMTYMHMAGIPFKLNTNPKNLQNSPKGKLPVIHDGGHVVADSYFIIDYLQQKFDVQLDSYLSTEQKAQAHLLTQSLDEGIYFCVVYFRWVSQQQWPKIKQAFFSELPLGLKQIIPIIARKSVQKSLYGQGMGRHCEQEILQITEHNLQSLSRLLGDKTYFFGPQKCSFDATAYGHLAQLILADFSHPINERARQFENLVDYCQRIQQEYYAETEL